MRYVFNSSLSWSEELARFIFIWQIWMGASIGLKDKKHIKVELLLSLFKEKGRRRIEIFGNIMFLAFCIFIVINGTNLTLDLIRKNSLSAAMRIPLYLVYLSLPFSGFIMSFRILGKLYEIGNKIEKNHEKSQFADLFRLISEGDRFYILQHWHLDTWHNIYGFSLEPSTQQDYFVGSYYCSTCPSSTFTQKLIITKPTPMGRVSLVNNQFSIREYSKTTLQKDIVSTEEFRKVLAEYFGIATEWSESVGENWLSKKE
jgi:TRAP-type C4-dicarboxylate transport system permease small subunit